MADDRVPDRAEREVPDEHEQCLCGRVGPELRRADQARRECGVEQLADDDDARAAVVPRRPAYAPLSERRHRPDRPRTWGQTRRDVWTRRHGVLGRHVPNTDHWSIEAHETARCCAPSCLARMMRRPGGRRSATRELSSGERSAARVRFCGRRHSSIEFECSLGRRSTLDDYEIVSKGEVLPAVPDDRLDQPDRRIQS